MLWLCVGQDVYLTIWGCNMAWPLTSQICTDVTAMTDSNYLFQSFIVNSFHWHSIHTEGCSRCRSGFRSERKQQNKELKWYIDILYTSKYIHFYSSITERILCLSSLKVHAPSASHAPRCKAPRCMASRSNDVCTSTKDRCSFMLQIRILLNVINY